MKDLNSDRAWGWGVFFVPTFCLLGAAAGGYVLYSDLHSSGGKNNGKIVGNVEQLHSQVRRKAASSYIWNQVNPEEGLFLKDSLQTGPGSAVTVKLLDGGLLDIGESSLIVMDRTTELSLGFLRGTVVVHQAQGDRQVSVSKDGKAQVQELHARLIQPKPLARYFLPLVSGQQPLKSLTFAWNLRSQGQSSNPAVTLQVATSERQGREIQFSTQTTKNIQVENQQSWVMNLAPGFYFWRLTQKDQVLSEVRRFKISGVVPLKPVWPERLQKVSFQNADHSVSFRWVIPRSGETEEDDLSQGRHRIQISRNPDFNKLVLNESIVAAAGTYLARDLPEGMVYWRIESLYQDSSKASVNDGVNPIRVLSEVQSFELQGIQVQVAQAAQALQAKAPEVVKTPVVLPYPSQVKPEEGTQFNLLDHQAVIEASWTEVPGASAYEVTVSAASRIVLQQVTSKTSFSFRNLAVGDYFWTVKAIDSEKHPGDPLPQRSLHLDYGHVLEAPQVLSPEVQ